MWTADTASRSRKNQSCESNAARLCWALTLWRFNKAVPKSKNPLPLRTARGFSLCPHFLLDEQPQCFFDKRRTTRHASAFLDPVECFDQITRNVGIQRHTTGLSLPRPVGGNASPNLCCAFFHVYK